MKKLVIWAHPSSSEAIYTSTIFSEFRKDKEFDVHHLDDDGNFDVKNERQLLLTHDDVIIIFPVHWYNIPWNLSKWLEQVLGYGFAFGTNYQLECKKVHIITTVGGSNETYMASGGEIWDYLRNFIDSITYCKMNVGLKYAAYEVTSLQKRDVINLSKELIRLLKDC